MKRLNSHVEEKLKKLCTKLCVRNSRMLFPNRNVLVWDVSSLSANTPGSWNTVLWYCFIFRQPPLMAHQLQLNKLPWELVLLRDVSCLIRQSVYPSAVDSALSSHSVDRSKKTYCTWNILALKTARLFKVLRIERPWC